jgi:outer membrane protein assembly factor BamD
MLEHLIARTSIRRRSAFLTRLGGLFLVAGALFLGACSTDEPEPYVERPVDELYNGALNLLIAGQYTDAAREFDEVERQHPYSQWATRAQLMSAFAYYQNDDYDDAILAADRFIQLHPGHKDVAYAYYLIGQSYYEQISAVSQDQRMTELARQAFTEVVRLFPNSEYGRDAQLKLELTDDHLAGKEMSIGRWYQQRNEWVAAVNRFRNVIVNYQTTSHVPEALLRLTETYLALGVISEAQTAAAVLGYNFPGSTWYQDSYNLLAQHNLVPQLNEDSWIAEATGTSG